MNPSKKGKMGFSVQKRAGNGEETQSSSFIEIALKFVLKTGGGERKVKAGRQ